MVTVIILITLAAVICWNDSGEKDESEMNSTVRYEMTNKLMEEIKQNKQTK